jgi:hypothetical protein
VIVSLEEWRRRHRGRDEEDTGWPFGSAAGLGDEIVLRACHEVAAGRLVEVHRLAADAVVKAGDGSFI